MAGTLLRDVVSLVEYIEGVPPEVESYLETEWKSIERLYSEGGVNAVSGRSSRLSAHPQYPPWSARRSIYAAGGHLLTDYGDPTAFGLSLVDLLVAQQGVEDALEYYIAADARSANPVQTAESRQELQLVPTIVFGRVALAVKCVVLLAR